MKNLIVVALIIIAFLGGYFVSQKYNFKVEIKNSTPTIIPSVTQPPLLGGDSDEHGCKGSAGYSWCEVKQKCLRVFEEKCEEEDLTAIIKQLLVAKHGSSANDLTITVSQKNGDYARGGASAPGGGGMWLATKANGNWKLAFDGNGTVDCQMIKTNYQFPAEMLKNFCD